MSPDRRATSRPGGVPPHTAPHRVRVPVNLHRWEGITFLHWPFDPEDVIPLLPDATAVLTWEGRAWVSGTPFLMNVRLPGMPVVPPRWTFPETNLRTYVTGPGGVEGLWFLRMEVSVAWFVAVLRVLGLPYFRQAMTVEVDDERIAYASRPRPRSPAGGHRIAVRPGAALDPPAGGPWDRFVTARWWAYHRVGPLLLRTPVEHPPWPLHTAEVEVAEVDALFQAAGLPPPVGPPLAHVSPGVDVRVGLPRVATVPAGQLRR